MRIPRLCGPIWLTAALLSSAAAADFQPSPPPAPDDFWPEPAAAPAGPGLTMADLEAFAAAVEFERGDADPRDKAARWSGLADERPRLAESARQRASEWQTSAAARSMHRERLTRLARAGDFGRLSALLRAPEHPPSDKALWAERYTRAYEAYPGFAVEDLDAMLAVFPPGPLAERLTAARARHVAAVRAALSTHASEHSELRDVLDRARAELVYAPVDGVHALCAVSKETGARLTCSFRGTVAPEYAKVDVQMMADEVAAFLKTGAGGTP